MGESPDAGAKVFGNESFNNLFGVLIRDAEHAKVAGNSFHDNCVGALVLGDAPGPAGFVKFDGNRVKHNDKACPAGEDNDVPLSGIGIALAGAHHVKIKHNLITNNVPSGDTAFTGGVVVVSGDVTAPQDNVVKQNMIVKNVNDLFWDGTGAGNVFERNVCQTSVPGGLCS